MAENYFFVTHEVLDHAHYINLVTAEPYGAISSFLGTVRSPNAGEPVKYIDYEGYDSMILKQMQVLADELRAEFDIGHLVLAHRLGRIYPAEISIAVLVSSQHRKDGLLACHKGIDRAKELLPVWKHETTEAGSMWLAGNTVATKPL